MRQLDERDGAGPRRRAARAAAAECRPRRGRFARIGVAIGVISIVTIVVGLIMPIGMFGFLAAVGLAIGIAALLAFMPAAGADRRARRPTDLPNGADGPALRFLSLPQRAAPCPRPRRPKSTRSAQILPALKQTLERVDDARSQCAGRAAADVGPSARPDRPLRPRPAAYRGRADGEGVSVDERLVEGLAAGRQALTRLPRSWPGPTWPRSRPRAASSSPATAKKKSAIKTPLHRAWAHAIEPSGERTG